MLNLIDAVGHLVLWLLFILLFPFAIIWSLNTLFPSLMIEYTFETWIAMFIIKGVIQTKLSVEMKKG